jgi:hypothetical protein
MLDTCGASLDYGAFWVEKFMMIQIFISISFWDPEVKLSAVTL